MRTGLRAIIWGAAVALGVVGAISAQEANPVTGRVKDKITLFTSTYYKPTPYDRGSLTLNFCDSRLSIVTPNRNYDYCVAPSRPLKLSGTRAEAIAIEPPIKGEWRFNSDYSLTFTPKETWRAGQAYHVTYKEGLFPPNVKLRGDGYDFSTQPFYLNSRKLDYLQDPTDTNKKLVTAQLGFNYPVKRDTVEKALAFAIEDKPSALPFTVNYDDQDTRVNVTVPVAALAEKAQFMTMQVAASLYTRDGLASLGTKSGNIEEYNERVMLPSLFDYLQFTDANTRVLKNSRYVPEQILGLESNSTVDPKELAASTEIHLLPKDKPLPNLSPKKDYNWNEPAEVTPEIRATLEKLPFTVVEEAEPSTITPLAFNAEAGRYLLVTVKKGMPAPGGYKLGRDYEVIKRVPELPREVRIMAEGSLLSLSGEKTLSVLSLGVPQLEYDVSRVKEENISHLISQTRGNFADPQFVDRYNFDEKNLSVVFHDQRAIADSNERKPSYSSFDFSQYLKGGKGLFFLSVKGTQADKEKEEPKNATHKKRSHYNASLAEDRRFILVTDLGLIAKQNTDNSWDVFVQSIAEGGPVGGVSLSVLGKNGEAVAQAQTGRDGHATLPDLSELKDEKTPVAFVARKSDDFSFLPFARYDRQLNYSKFDVEGNSVNEGMRAYLFNDRGIYRPGETAHIGMIVKARDWTKTVAGLPLVLEVTNPRGQVVNKQTLQLSAEGVMTADYVSSETGTTGMYNATLYLGKGNDQKGTELGNVRLRVEEFQPDRMKITSSIEQKGKVVEGLAWVKPEELNAVVDLKHLYGAPATGRKVTGKMTLLPGAFGFETYRDYRFAAEGSVTKSFEETLTETKTDDAGKAKFELPLAKYGASTFRLSFLGEGFEPDSGRSVKTAKSMLVSPLDYVVGVKDDGNLSYINPNDARNLSLVAVNASLTAIEAKDLAVEIKHIKRIQTLTKDARGNYDYRTTTVEAPFAKGSLSLPAEGTHYKLPTDKAGSYVFILRNGGGTVLAREEFTVVGEANAAGDLTREAAMQLKLDKSAYGPGEEITLNIQSPYTGTGLITIETDHVHAWQWFTATTTQTTQKIRIPDGFEGKGFINVQFTRDLKSKDIFMSPLSFAVAPFSANVDAHDQKVMLDMPKDIKPGDTVTVQYHSKQTGKVMLYAVDEGILLYAHYQNPTPLDYFLMRRGLEVRTSQIMDLLLPEYSILKSLSAIGGDGFANDGKNLNPFKRKTQPPVAYWSGLLETGPENRNWTFTVPSYFNGGVRVLAVGVSVDAMGTAEAGVNVHGPLIVTPNLPLFAAPGDTFTTTATVTNNAKGSGPDAKVTLAVEASPQLLILDAPKEPLAVAEGKEVAVQIKLKATDRLGSGELHLTAGLGNDHFTIAQTLSVRPPVTSMTSLVSGYTKDATKTVEQTRALYPELSETKASVSSLPVSLIGGLRDYLVTYPYGCTEQMTSQNFPNVILYGNSELIKAFGWKPEEMERSLRVSFNSLRERQSASGGWGMWNYYSEQHAFISAYVMHFLIEAREKSLPVPEDVYDMGLRNLKHLVNREPSSLENAREKAYGIYLLTRAGEITSNYIPHLVTYLDNNYPSSWHNDLAAIYLAATYQQMQMQPEAEALLAAFKLAEPVTYTTSWHEYAFYDSLTKYSQYVYMMAKHFPKHLETMDKEVIWRVANFVGEGTYNTLSSSYAVMAVDAYVTARKDALAKVTISAKGADGKDQALEVLGEKLKVALLKAPAASLTFGSESPGFFYQIASSGYDKKMPEKPISAGLELKRDYTDAKGKPISGVALGEVVNVKLTLRSGNDEAVPNIAVVDLLPGGFELEPEPVVKQPETTQTESEEGDVPAEAKAEPAAEPKEAEKPLWQPESVDRREDRIILYGRAPTSEYSYHYRIKATSRGVFAVPPAYAESMYDPALKARGLAGSIEVK